MNSIQKSEPCFSLIYFTISYLLDTSTVEKGDTWGLVIYGVKVSNKI